MSEAEDEGGVFPHLNRRGFLYGAGAALAGLSLSVKLAPGVARAQGFSDYPFTLGVASGDPAPDGVVLWTRLAPDPLRADGTGGMPARRVPIEWEVAADENMTQIVQRGAVLAAPEAAHTVHVELRGLQPAHWYWYRFKAGGIASPIGRTKTAPAPGAAVDQFRFAFVSCQAWQDGFFAAYRNLAREDLDLVVHLGDYIYEGGINSAGPRGALPPDHVRPEITTLDQYRWRHSLYKLDQNLQAAHALFPFAVTWDDHEVENNYTGLIRENNNPPGDFVRRRADAYQAYYEHQPLRRAQTPTGPDLPLYRRLTFGSLAEFNVLDTRQYRDDQPCGDGTRQIPCAGYPANSVLGDAQERWLLEGLDRSGARWNVLAQQIFMSQRDFLRGTGQTLPMDSWDGYAPARQRILDFIAAERPANPVVLTGDVHANWVADLKVNFNEPQSATLGAEFVGTSITSGGNGVELNASDSLALAENPHIKFVNRRRGYVKCTLTSNLWRADYKVLPFVNQEDAAAQLRASFVVENGRPGAVLDREAIPTGPNITIEAETLLPALAATAVLEAQNNTGGLVWSNDTQLLFRAAAAGDQFTVAFYVQAAGEYELSAGLTEGPDYGAFRLLVDDNPLGDVFDAYEPALALRRSTFGRVGLNRGQHLLKLTVAGKNPANATANYYAGIDTLEFVRVS